MTDIFGLNSAHPRTASTPSTATWLRLFTEHVNGRDVLPGYPRGGESEARDFAAAQLRA